MSRPEWLAVRLQFIKGLNSPTEAQRLLVELAERSELDKSDARVFDQLMRMERINMKADEAKAETEKLLRTRRLEQERARAKAHAELGAVVEEVGFPLERDLLAGVLLEALDRLKADPALRTGWSSRGVGQAKSSDADEKRADAA
ncbi:conjugal transfer protein TraD [Burkholderia pyrrocinia]